MAVPNTLQARWLALAPREQRAVLLAAAVIAAALTWLLLLAPALRTLRAAPAQSALLAADLERMQNLQARARMLQAKPAISAKEALQALQSAAVALGPAATVQVQAEQVTVTLKDLAAQDVAPWLSHSASAGLSPVQVQLQRSASGKAAWSGTLVFRLPTAN